MSDPTPNHIGIRTRDGETYGIVFTDEHAFDAIRQVRSWALNPELALTHEQADLICEAILEVV